MERFEYNVVTRARRELAWRIFSDWTLWPKFSPSYGEIRWAAGEPWQPGSRLSIEIVKPVRTRVEHVIVLCAPPARVGWIDHAMGTTLEQWVEFHSVVDGGTSVHTWGEFTGLTRRVVGLTVKAFLTDFTRAWYDNFRAECDRQADASSLAS